MAECYKRRLYQWRLKFCFAIFYVVCFFCIVFSFSVLSEFYFVFCPVFSSVNQHEWHCVA